MCRRLRESLQPPASPFGRPESVSQLALVSRQASPVSRLGRAGQQTGLQLVGQSDLRRSAERGRKLIESFEGRAVSSLRWLRVSLIGAAADTRFAFEWDWPHDFGCRWAEPGASGGALLIHHGFNCNYRQWPAAALKGSGSASATLSVFYALALIATNSGRLSGKANGTRSSQG